MIGMTKSLAREVAQRGITANCIAPGFISTPMTSALNEKQTEEIAKMIPAQRFGLPEEVAAGVVYLASNEAGYITGRPCISMAGWRWCDAHGKRSSVGPSC